MAKPLATRKAHEFHPLTELDRAEKSLVKTEKSLIRRIHYPRLTLTIIIFLIFYYLLYGRQDIGIHNALLSLGYFGIFIAGILYSYGFTAGPAALIFLSMSKSEHLLLASVIGALGSVVGDSIIFFFVKREFGDELDRLSHNHVMQVIENGEKKLFGHFQKYALAAFAGIFIGSPLPTEIGVMMLACLKRLSIKKFLIIDFCLDFAGVFLILLAGRAI